VESVADKHFQPSESFLNGRIAYAPINPLKIYDKNAESIYVGMDTHDSETEQDKLFNRPTEEGGNYYSAVDTATFSRNEQFPCILLTA
jgi:hypothetical protein